MTRPNLFPQFHIPYGFLTIIYTHTIKDNLAYHLDQFLYVKSMGLGEALTSVPPPILGEVIDKNFYLPLSQQRLRDLTREDLESTLCFPPWKSTVIKHLLYVLSSVCYHTKAS